MIQFVLQSLYDYPIVFFVEVAAMLYLRWRQSKRRFLWVLGSYFLFFAASVSTCFIGLDELGYAVFIPLHAVWPWDLLFERLPFPGYFRIVVVLLIGFVINCAFFYLIGCVRYPEVSNEGSVSPPHRGVEPTR